MLPCLHLLKVCIRVEILDDTTIQSFLNGVTQSGHLLLLVLKKAQTRPNNFAGVVIPARKDARLNKLLKMRT